LSLQITALQTQFTGKLKLFKPKWVATGVLYFNGIMGINIISNFAYSVKTAASVMFFLEG
jgi:hypothetical protein